MPAYNQISFSCPPSINGNWAIVTNRQSETLMGSNFGKFGPSNFYKITNYIKQEGYLVLQVFSNSDHRLLKTP